MKRILLRLAARMRAQRRHALIAARFEDFNDHLLADIGLTRGRISPVVDRDPAISRWRDTR